MGYAKMSLIIKKSGDFMDQNLSSYYVFYMVVKKGNISAASKELFISQPAVSKSVTKLESSLNTKLLVRGSRGVTLTNEGKILYERLQEAFHAIELGEEQLKYETNTEIEHLTVGVSTTLCKYLLIPYLKEFVKENPHVRISIICQSSDETIKALENKKIDIGLVGEPGSLNPDFVFSKVRTIEDTFVTTQSYLDHVMIRAGLHSLSEENYKEIFENSTVMLMDKKNLSRRYVDQHISANELKAENIIEISTMDLLIEFAGIGIGIACVIKNFVEDEIKNGTLVEVPLPFAIPKRNIGLIYERKQFKNPALDAFLKFYKEYKN